MDPSAAKLAQALDDLASPPVVDCVECGTAIVLTNRAKLYCSDVCHQTLKLVHYGRAVVADGRIDRLCPGADREQPSSERGGEA